MATHSVGGAVTVGAPVATSAWGVFTTAADRGGAVHFFEDRGKAIVRKHKWGHYHLMPLVMPLLSVITIVFSSCRTFDAVLSTRLTLCVSSGQLQHFQFSSCTIACCANSSIALCSS